MSLHDHQYGNWKPKRIERIKAKADDFYSESLFFIKLLKAAGEDVEAIR